MFCPKLIVCLCRSVLYSFRELFLYWYLHWIVRLIFVSLLSFKASLSESIGLSVEPAVLDLTGGLEVGSGPFEGIGVALIPVFAVGAGVGSDFVVVLESDFEPGVGVGSFQMFVNACVYS